MALTGWRTLFAEGEVERTGRSLSLDWRERRRHPKIRVELRALEIMRRQDLLGGRCAPEIARIGHLAEIAISGEVAMTGIGKGGPVQGMDVRKQKSATATIRASGLLPVSRHSGDERTRAVVRSMRISGSRILSA